ncbi:MAG: Hsp70 family protein, partial [Deinococcus sp.]|nr:Hsp70 family protein [Deinococcus sp.]
LARDVRIEDVVSHAIGVKVKGKEGFKVFEFIRKNAKTPLGVSNFVTTERDRATEFDLEIYQGNSTVVEECALVGAVHISGLTSLPRAKQRIELRLHTDRDGLIHITITDHTSGHRQEHTVQPRS